jgi:hypothetical protein
MSKQKFEPGQAVQHKVFGGKYAVLHHTDDDVACRGKDLERVVFIAAELEPYVEVPRSNAAVIARAYR